MSKFIRTIILLIIIWFSVDFGFKFIKSDFFKVLEIEVKGETPFTEKDIISKLENIKGMSVFLIDLNSLEASLSSDVRIEKIRIKKKLPSKLIIEVQERKPIGFTKVNDKFYLIDNKMKIFGNLKESQEKDMPILNFDYTDELEKDKIKKIIENIKNEEFIENMSEIIKYDTYYCAIFNDGTKIFIDENIKNEKFDLAMKIYKKDKERKIEYIDLRFKDINVK